MASFRNRGRVWYYRFIDADGEKRWEKGCSDRRVAEELARDAESSAAKIRSGLVDPKELVYHKHAAMAVGILIAVWRRKSRPFLLGVCGVRRGGLGPLSPRVDS
jgi:hypothetical protein